MSSLKLGLGFSNGISVGKFGFSSGQSDTTAPTVAITSSEISPTAAATIPITITFSEPVTGFAVGDITISGGSLGALGGSDDVYTVTWTPPAGGGALTMDIAEGVAQDAAGNTNTAATQYTITVYGAEQTVVLQPLDTSGFAAGMNVEAPTTNNGGLIIGDATAGAGTHANRGLVKFDISSIPSTAYIVSAKLSVWLNAGGRGANPSAPIVINLNRALQNWNKSQATWNVYSTGNNWGTAGGSGDGVDRVASASSSLSIALAAPDGTFYDWTGLGSDVQGFLNGSLNNYGWLMSAPTAENINSHNYASLHGFGADFSGVRNPKLTVVYRPLP